MIAITAAQLRAVPRAIGVAAGEEKLMAIDTALRTGITDTFVTDLATQTKLLEREGGV